MSKSLFTASTTWKGPYDIEKVVYFSGITQHIYSDLKLVNSYDEAYPENTAFKLVGTSSSDFDRVYDPFSTDNLILSNIDDSVSYKIDDDKNLVIFPSSYTLEGTDLTNVKAKLYKNYASIFKSNIVSFEPLIDFRNLKEKAITSMVSSTDGIYLSGVSGKIWFYDGYVIKGPIFTTEDDIALPATALLKHRFSHESEDYLYVSSDEKPRLFRSKLSLAKNGTDWEEVYASGELAASSGGILSMASAMNKIFIGCRNNKILIYSRTNEIVLSDPIDLVSETIVETDTPTETLTTITISSNDVDDFEPAYSDIKCLDNAKNIVFAGLSNKSEIYSYQEITQNNPDNFENWVSFNFNEVFRNDPAPAQYYSYNSSTLSKNDSNLASAKYYYNTGFGSSGRYVKEAIVLKGSTLSSTGTTVNGQRLFEFSDGSDWEQALRLNLPDQEFINLQCASNSAITSLTETTEVDGYVLKNYDLVLLKDQTNSGTEGIFNGIYRFEAGTLVSYKSFTFAEGITKIGFYIQNGYVNGRSRLFISKDNFESDIYTFYKNKYTLEFEIRNLYNSAATACTVLDECRYLNAVLDNEERILSSTGFTGYQGFEIGDLYGIVNIQLNNDTIKVTSGSNTITKTLPTYGSYKNWNFSSTAGTAVTNNGWTSSEYISSIGATIQTITDFLGQSYNQYLLRITPSTYGNPSIIASDINVDIDPEAVLKLRVKMTPPSLFGFEDAKIRLYWAELNSDFSNTVTTPIVTSDDFVEYTIEPMWKGNINSLKIEFVNLPESSLRPTYIDVDYIKLINENIIFDINNVFSNIRVGVEDRDLKIWFGKQDYPYIYSKNFITLDNYSPKYLNPNLTTYIFNKPYIRFGKIDNFGGDSLFAYSKLSFIVGDVYEPVQKLVQNFHLSQKLPSTGGVRMFSYHDGSIYCATDGFDSNNVDVNPDDRQSKLFYYNADQSFWNKSEATFERKRINNSDGTYQLLGLVRPLNMISYKGILYLSGNYQNIKVE